MHRTDFGTLWEKARVGCFERTASKHVYYLGWNRLPAQVGCMRQVLGTGALGRPRGLRRRGRGEGGSGWGIPVNPWLIHVNIWQKPLQYCKVISLQLIKINGKNKIKWLSLGKKKEYLSPNVHASSWGGTERYSHSINQYPFAVNLLPWFSYFCCWFCCWKWPQAQCRNAV